MADAEELTGSRAATLLPSRAAVAHVVFYLGLMLTLAGFLGDKAEDMPWVMERVAPTYARPSRGLDTLQARGELTRADEGFAELAALVRGELVSSGKPEGTLEIVRFVRGTAMLAFGDARAGEVVPITIEFTGATLKSNMESFRAALDSIKKGVLLRYSVWVFALGLLTTLAGRPLRGPPADGPNLHLSRWSASDERARVAGVADRDVQHPGHGIPVGDRATVGVLRADH